MHLQCLVKPKSVKFDWCKCVCLKILLFLIPLKTGLMQYPCVCRTSSMLWSNRTRSWFISCPASGTCSCPTTLALRSAIKMCQTWRWDPVFPALRPHHHASCQFIRELWFAGPLQTHSNKQSMLCLAPLKSWMIIMIYFESSSAVWSNAAFYVTLAERCSGKRMQLLMLSPALVGLYIFKKIS